MATLLSNLRVRLLAGDISDTLENAITQSNQGRGHRRQGRGHRRQGRQEELTEHKDTSTILAPKRLDTFTHATSHLCLSLYLSISLSLSLSLSLSSSFLFPAILSPSLPIHSLCLAIHYLSPPPCHSHALSSTPEHKMQEMYRANLDFAPLLHLLPRRGELCQLSSRCVLNATYKRWAMFKLQRQGGELCQNCPGKVSVSYVKFVPKALFITMLKRGELCQNCPGKAASCDTRGELC